MARRAVFLDRDGTLIVDQHYLSDPDKVIILPGVIETLTALQIADFALIVVSNQSGVGRGYFPRQVVDLINERVARLLADRGVKIDGWYYCPHAPDARCRCRKPAPGLLEEAAADLDIDLRRSYVIGDKISDCELVETAGLRAGVLLQAGRDRFPDERFHVIGHMGDAASWILSDASRSAS